MVCITNDYLKWGLSGTLMGIGFVVPTLWFVGLIGGGLFLHLLLTGKVDRNFLLGAITAFTLKYAFATSIFWSVYPVSFLPLELGQLQIFIIFIYWFTSSLWLGLGVVALVTTRWLWDKFYFEYKHQSLLWPVIILIWVLAETLGSLLFSVMMQGDGGGINTAYSLGYSGYLLAESNGLMQFARLVGVYSLSGVFIILAGVGYFLMHTKRFKIALSFLVLLLLTAHVPLSNERVYEGEVGLEIVVVDTYFESRPKEIGAEQFAQRQSLLEAVGTALKTNPDYLLLPEDARFFIGRADIDSFELKYGSLNTIIVDSRTVQGGEGLNLEAYIYNSQTAESRQIAKRYLVPQGEYVPTAYSNLFTLFGQEAVVDYIEDHINYVVGGYTTQTNLPVDTPAILFCFESVDPMGVRRLTQEHPHAPFVSHPISHAWFNQSEILWNQLDSMLRVQALWNNTYIVSASNQGRSQLYTPQGSVLDMDEIASGENWSVKKVEIFLP